MKIENIYIHKSKKHKRGHIQTGLVNLTIKELKLDIGNIIYSITKEKEIIITCHGIVYPFKDETGEVVNKFTPNISFHDPSVWDEIVEAIKKAIASTIS